MAIAAPDFIADTDIDTPTIPAPKPSRSVANSAPSFIADIDIPDSGGITGGISTANFDTAASIIDRPSPSSLRGMAPDAQLAAMETSRRSALRAAPFASTETPDFIPDIEPIPAATPGLGDVNPQTPGIIESASRGFALGIPQAVGGVVRNVGRFDPVQRAINATVGMNPANDLADYIAGGPDAIRDMTPAPTTVTGSLAEGMAQYSPSIGASMVNPVLGAAIGGSQSAEAARQQVQPMLDRGEVTPGQAAAYEAGSGAIGAATGAIGGKLIRGRDGYLATGALGGALGGGTQAAQNVVTQQTIDPNVGVLDNVREATVIGGATAIGGKAAVDAFDGIFDRIWGSVRQGPQNATGATTGDAPPQSPPNGQSSPGGTQRGQEQAFNGQSSSRGQSSRQNASEQQSAEDWFRGHTNTYNREPGGQRTGGWNGQTRGNQTGSQPGSRPRNTTAAEAEAFSWFGISSDDAIDIDTVKAVWRTKAQQTHPDAGGNQGDFERTQQALQTVLRWMRANGRPQTAPGKAQAQPKPKPTEAPADVNRGNAAPAADDAGAYRAAPGSASDIGQPRPQGDESVVGMAGERPPQSGRVQPGNQRNAGSDPTAAGVRPAATGSPEATSPPSVKKPAGKWTPPESFKPFTGIPDDTPEWRKQTPPTPQESTAAEATAAQPTGQGTSPNAGAGGQSKRRYTTIPPTLLNVQLHDWGNTMALRATKGSKIQSTRGKYGAKFDQAYRSQLDKVDGDAASLIAEVRNRTDEVWKIKGRAGGYFVAPKEAIAEARQSLADRGIDPEAEVAAAAVERANRKQKYAANREARERRINGIADQLQRLHGSQPGVYDAGRGIQAADPKGSTTLAAAQKWANEQPKDSEAYVLGYLHAKAKKDPKGTEYQWIRPLDLEDGHKLKIGDETLYVEHDRETGDVMLHDGVTMRVDENTVVPVREVEAPPSDSSEVGLPPESETAGDIFDGLDDAPAFIPDEPAPVAQADAADDFAPSPATESLEPPPAAEIARRTGQPAPQADAPAVAVASSEAADTLTKYDNGDFDSFDDFVDAVDATGEHTNAVDTYRNEQAENRRLSGRNDMDAAEDRFVAAVRANAKKDTADEKFTAPSGFKPFDADAVGASSAPQTGIFGQSVTLRNSGSQDRFEFEIERKPMQRPVSRDETEQKIAEQYDDAGTPEMFGTGEAATPTEPSGKLPQGSPAAPDRLAGAFRKAADNLQKQIDEKRRPMTQNPTPKRQREYRHRVTEADLLERVQRAYRALADARDAGTLPPELANIKTRNEITELVRRKMKSNGGYYDAYYELPEYEKSTPAAQALQSLIENKSPHQKAADAQREKAERVRKLEDDVRFTPIEGFFPTPKPVVTKMLELADIEPGMRVLEPSAGKGDIADAIRDAGVEVDTVEIVPRLRDLLEAKGHKLVGDDFLKHNGRYDRIVMNPPFERGQDIEHVQRAFDLLKPGGRVVAVMSEGAFFRNDKKATAFREWLESNGGTSEQMDAAFAGSDAFRRTGVKTRLVTIDKADATGVRVQRRNRSGMAYVGWLEPVVDVGRAVVQAGTSATRGAINIAVDDLVGRVRAAGTKSATEAAELASRALNTSSATLGMLADDIAKALKLTGAGMNPSLHRAAMSLQRVKWTPGKDYGTAAIMHAVEGKATSTAAERAVIASIQALTDKLGRIYKANGHKQFDHKTQTWKPFNYIPGGKVFVRLQTPELTGAIMQGKGELWTKTIDAIADLNPQLANPQTGTTARDVVERIFKEQRSAMLASNEPGAFSRLNAEFRREIEHVPTHIRVGSQQVEIIESHPYAYAKRLAEHGAMRVGFVKHFGQELPGSNKIADLVKRYTDENGENKTVLDLLRSLSGVPVESPWIDPGTPLATMVRNAQSVMSLAKSSLLSASAITNIPEPLGNIQAFSGRGDAAKAMWKLLSSPKATIAALEHLGAITKDIADVTFDPARPMQSFARVLRDASAKLLGHRWINELQEKLAAATMLEKVQRLKAGKGAGGDVIDLKWLGFDIDTARRMAKGQGTAAEYNDAVRRAPQKLVGSPMPAARKTRVSHNRVYAFAVAFENYAQMKVRSFLHLGQTWAETTQRLRQNPGSRDARREFVAANLKLGRLVLGTTAAGAAQYFLWAFALGGVEGVKIAGNEFKDRPVGFLRDSFMYTMFAGPYGALLRMASQNQGNSAGEAAVRATLPGFLMVETVDAVQGEGRYAGLSTAERMADLGSRLLPVHRVVKQLAVSVGFGGQTAQEEQDMDTAVRAYWKWKFAEKQSGRFIPGEIDENAPGEVANQRIRESMKRAYRRFRAFDNEGAKAEMMNALEVRRAHPGRTSPEANIRQKILGNRLLAKLKTDEQRAQLRSRIGDSAYRKLESHDALLEAWAESVDHSAGGSSHENAGIQRPDSSR